MRTTATTTTTGGDKIGGKLSLFVWQPVTDYAGALSNANKWIERATSGRAEVRSGLEPNSYRLARGGQPVARLAGADSIERLPTRPAAVIVSAGPVVATC